MNLSVQLSNGQINVEFLLWVAVKQAVIKVKFNGSLIRS
jgi:hypothetical protein